MVNIHNKKNAGYVVQNLIEGQFLTSKMSKVGLTMTFYQSNGRTN